MNKRIFIPAILLLFLGGGFLLVNGDDETPNAGPGAPTPSPSSVVLPPDDGSDPTDEPTPFYGPEPDVN